MRIASTTESVLATRDLWVYYGEVAALRGVNIDIRGGELVALLGPNGAGKTTLLRAMAGFTRTASGTVRFEGSPCTAPAHVRARRGLSYTGEDRHVFAGLTVRQCLRLVPHGEERGTELFPELRKLMGRRAGLLSGGEQQMLSLARSLALKPLVVLVDELSLGLAPLVRGRLLHTLRMRADEGLAVFVVEQSVRDVLDVADRAYVLRRGEVVDESPASRWKNDLDGLGLQYLS